MLLCYIDESGTPEIPGNTSHYVLVGFSIPVNKWKEAEQNIQTIKMKYGINDKEIHTAWILRKYFEQSKIHNFELLSREQRVYEVNKHRKTELLKLQKTGGKQYTQTKKNYKETSDYIHLTYDERKGLILELAQMIESWDFARLFAECIDKVSYDPFRSYNTIAEQALEQITTRFEYYLLNYSKYTQSYQYGLLIHDNNETVAKKHTALMKTFHEKGTFWKNIPHIIETPLFVNSSLTNMVQISDLCAYSIRRYLENKESELFDLVFMRADRKNNKVVGIRHFPGSGCNCKICQAHK
ncbi:MAG: DUF3800 domain-containing protein [Spirochaetia bacterium]|jgi:hypothetical protein|nr:DUF3800 domain-containing protein [Spirochaetia bacterium]